MTNRFFTAFEPTPTEAWEKVLNKELKGADYSEKLIWQSPENFDVPPYYRAAENRSPVSSHADWLAWAEAAYDVADFSERAKIAAVGGMHSLLVRCKADQVAKAEAMLTDLDLRLVFQLSDSPADGSGENLRFDPVLSGKAYANSSWCFADVTSYKDKGVRIAEELGLALAHLHEQILTVEPATTKLSVKLASGPNFFFELAKLRALRILLPNLLSAYDLEAAAVEIIATETTWNKSTKDPHNNLLRTSNAALASVCGGCNAFIALPFRENDLQAFRLANNTNLLLWHEGQLGKLTDPGAGSWYVETITDKLVELGWEYFKAIEAAGGFSPYKETGALQHLLNERQSELEAAIESGTVTLVGQNKYLSPQNAESK